MLYFSLPDILPQRFTLLPDPGKLHFQAVPIFLEHIQIFFPVRVFVLMLFSLQVALVGHYLTKCRLMDRALALLSFALFLSFFPMQNYILFTSGGIVFIILTFLQFKAVRRRPVSSLKG